VVNFESSKSFLSWEESTRCTAIHEKAGCELHDIPINNCEGGEGSHSVRSSESSKKECFRKPTQAEKCTTYRSCGQYTCEKTYNHLRSDVLQIFFQSLDLKFTNNKSFLKANGMCSDNITGPNAKTGVFELKCPYKVEDFTTFNGIVNASPDFLEHMNFAIRLNASFLFQNLISDFLEGYGVANIYTKNQKENPYNADTSVLVKQSKVAASKFISLRSSLSSLQEVKKNLSAIEGGIRILLACLYPFMMIALALGKLRPVFMWCSAFLGTALLYPVAHMSSALMNIIFQNYLSTLSKEISPSSKISDLYPIINIYDFFDFFDGIYPILDAFITFQTAIFALVLGVVSISSWFSGNLTSSVVYTAGNTASSSNSVDFYERHEKEKKEKEEEEANERLKETMNHFKH
jgi:hypothetical protein